MSLRSKVLLFVVAVSASFTAATWLLQQTLILPQFASLELREADQDLKRSREAIRRELEFLECSSVDYSAWDDTYDYVLHPGNEYESENLVPETFENLGIDLLAIIGPEGQLVWARQAAADGALANADALVKSVMESPHLRKTRDGTLRTASGMLAKPLGPMLVGASLITNTARDAPARGSLVMGRFVDESLVRGLVERIGVALALFPLAAVPEEDRAALAHLGEGGETWRDASDSRQLRSYQQLTDLEGRPVLLLRAELPRAVMARAHESARGAALVEPAEGSPRGLDVTSMRGP